MHYSMEIDFMDGSDDFNNKNRFHGRGAGFLSPASHGYMYVYVCIYLCVRLLLRQRTHGDCTTLLDSTVSYTVYMHSLSYSRQYPLFRSSIYLCTVSYCMYV